jgi:hypothetical protein
MSNRQRLIVGTPRNSLPNLPRSESVRYFEVYKAAIHESRHEYKKDYFNSLPKMQTDDSAMDIKGIWGRETKFDKFVYVCDPSSEAFKTEDFNVTGIKWTGALGEWNPKSLLGSEGKHLIGKVEDIDNVDVRKFVCEPNLKSS